MPLSPDTRHSLMSHENTVFPWEFAAKVLVSPQAVNGVRVQGTWRTPVTK